jgi:hypothetical protein
MPYSFISGLGRFCILITGFIDLTSITNWGMFEGWRLWYRNKSREKTGQTRIGSGFFQTRLNYRLNRTWDFSFEFHLHQLKFPNGKKSSCSSSAGTVHIYFVWQAVAARQMDLSRSWRAGRSCITTRSASDFTESPVNWYLIWYSRSHTAAQKQ